MRRSAAIVAVIAALMMTLFITLRSFSLSSEQAVARDFGRFSSQVGLGNFVGLTGGETDRALDALAAVNRGGVTDSMLLLETYDIRPDTPDRPFTVYLEADWASEPFPARYSLVDGTWPSHPGEVVVTAPFAMATGNQNIVSILSGNHRLQVVGHIRDHFAAKQSKILAAPGTWASFDASDLAQKFPTLAATPTLLWSGGNHDQVISLLGDVIRIHVEAKQKDSVEFTLAALTNTRNKEMANTRRSWVDRIPIAYQIPSLGLPALGVITMFGLNRKRLRRNLGTLRAVGIGARDATMAVVLAGSAWAVLAAIAGTVAGIGLGAMARPIGQRYLTRPLSAFPDLADPALRSVVVVALTCVGYALVTMLQQRRTTPRSLHLSLPGGRSVSTTRHAAAGLATAVAVVQVIRLETMPETMQLVGTIAVAVLLLTPDLVGAILRRLPASGARRRLARQQLRFDGGRVLVAVALLTASLGPALAMATLLETLTHSEEENFVADVAVGQVNIYSPRGLTGAPPEDLRRIVVDRLDAAPPVHLGYLLADNRIVQVEGHSTGVLMVVDTVDDAMRLSNDTLTFEQHSTLIRGGVLVWDRADKETRVLNLVDLSTDSVLANTEPLPAVSAPFPRSWQQRAGGLLLTSTAQRLGLPVSRSEYVFTDITEEMSIEARQSALDAGYDPSLVRIYSKPKPAVAQSVYVAAELGLGVLMLLTVISVSRAQAATLRSYLSGLVALGLPRRWVREVLILEVAVLMAVSTLLGLVIALVPVVAAVVQVPTLTLSIPWLTLAGLIAIFAAAGLVATLFAISRLRATDRETFAM